MAIPEGVREKLLRAERHFKELEAELKAYYESDPGELFVNPATNSKPRTIGYRQRKPMPLRFGLICGDCLQCLRSSLDYLAWELVLVGGIQKPTRQTAFPITLSAKEFKHEVVKRKRLDGLLPSALALIETLQPFSFAPQIVSPLIALEELTNINKHRHIIFTDLVGTFTKPKFDIPHLYGSVVWDDNLGVRRQAPVWAYARFRDGTAKGIEITILVDTLARYIGSVVFGEFSHFFP